jgi:hypothetical protein
MEYDSCHDMGISARWSSLALMANQNAWGMRSMMLMLVLWMAMTPLGSQPQGLAPARRRRHPGI